LSPPPGPRPPGVYPIGWIAEYAARKGLRYEPDADERWLRAWEPYTTLKVALRYEHALQATGDMGSITVARMIGSVDVQFGATVRQQEISSWIAIAQDVRIEQVVAGTCDTGRSFGEPLDLVSMPRRLSADPAFDHVFATFAPSQEDVDRGLTSSLRKLLLGWRIPLHFELRRGGFIIAPVALSPDPQGLSWLVRAVHLFGEKAAKRGVNV
jgi:hypothetical protein